MSSKTKSSGNVIQQLEGELARCAMKFRAAAEGSVQRTEAVRHYHQIMDKLFQTGKWDGTLDLDSQLPDEFMPSLYQERLSENSKTPKVPQNTDGTAPHRQASNNATQPSENQT